MTRQEVEEKVNDFFKSNISLEQNDFEHVNKMVVDLIESVYEVSKIAGAL